METPPLHKLQLGVLRLPAATNAGPTPDQFKRETPQDVSNVILEQIVEQLVQGDVKDLCNTLYQNCLLANDPGLGRCGPHHPIWKKACRRMGLVEVERDAQFHRLKFVTMNDTTDSGLQRNWHTVFQDLCAELKQVLAPSTSKYVEVRDKMELFGAKRKALWVYQTFLRGEGASVPVKVETQAFTLLRNRGDVPLVVQALVGLGGIPFHFENFEAYAVDVRNALTNGDPAAVRMAIGNGANAGVYALKVHGTNGNAHFVRLLLQAGANPNALWDWDESVLMNVACNFDWDSDKVLVQNTESVKHLLEFGANANWFRREQHEFQLSDPSGHTALTELLSVGVPVEGVYHACASSSARCGDALFERCKLLFEYKANATHREYLGRPPLWFAVRLRYRKQDVVRLVQDHIVEGLALRIPVALVPRRENNRATQTSLSEAGPRASR